MGDDHGPRTAQGASSQRDMFSSIRTTLFSIERDIMNKLLSSLVFAALASFGFSAHAASHAGGAPMKADAPAKAKADAAKPAASAPKAKKAQKAASGAKADMKKEEAKK